MSDDLWVADPESEHRRRAVWGLGILALAAVIVVALMVFLIGSSGGNDNTGLPNTSQFRHQPTSSVQTTPPSGQHHSSSGNTPSGSTSGSTTATTSCSSGNSCTLDGDAGKVIDAVNQFRQSNGRTAVPGTTTAQAKNCALSNGDGGACPTSYSWEPVSPQDGSAVVQKIASRSGGRSFLLDPSMKALQIGWAFVGGQYSCTIVAVT